MAWVQVQQRRAFGRPAGEVRAGVTDVRGTRLLALIIGADAMAKAGMKHGDLLVLHRGTDADEGRVRVTPGDGAETRKLGKVPQSPAGIVRFGLPADWPLVSSGSTEAPEWTAAKGAVTLRLPDALTTPRPAPAPPAIPLVEPKGEMVAEALRLFRARQSVQQVARAVKLPVAELVRLEDQAKAERASKAA